MAQCDRPIFIVIYRTGIQNKQLQWINENKQENLTTKL